MKKLISKKILISKKASIKSALKSLSSSGKKCLLVMQGKTLHGTLTDGDLRRSILKGALLNQNIEKIYNKKPFKLKQGSFSDKNLEKIFLEQQVDIIPVVNYKNKLTKVLIKDEIFSDKPKKILKKIKNEVVIMAGGKGTRLEPFTKILPKPLVPVNGKPVIQHIIDKFSEHGVRKFYITINFKSKIIKAFFNEVKTNNKIIFFEEKKPLGTIGALRSLKNKFKNPILFTNCDTIIEENYIEIIKFHEDEKNDLTLVASAKEYSVPYGLCKLNSEGYLDQIIEKPKYDFLVNTGFYVVNPKVISLIPLNKFFNTNDFISLLKLKKRRVGVFPIDGKNWLDVGEWPQYKKTVSKL
jgi:dTDP-glucose pyrophosphorylase